MQNKVCIYCEKEFKPKYKAQIYCSKSCKSSHHQKLILERKINEYNKSPKICLYCGGPIPFEKRTNKCCSQSCACSLGNTIRERHPWTKEQRLNLSNKMILDRKESQSKYIIHNCKYCGVKLDKPKSRTCSECKQYVGYLRTFNKMNILNGSLKDRYNKLYDILCTEYFDYGNSLPVLSEKYNLDITTVYKFIKSSDKGCRDISDGIHNAIKMNRYHIISKPFNFISGKHISWDGESYTYKSSWEDKYMTELDGQKINYIYEPFRIEYYDSLLDKNRFSFPDFYLPDTNEIIELKSNYTIKGKVQEMKDKFKAYQKNGYIPKLLLNWKFVDIDTLPEDPIEISKIY